jgi:DNA repair protein RecO (recombination protein O)
VSYSTYITNALVCGSFEQQSADKTLLLFTKDYGMLFASARSVREEVSKQRCALQDFSRIRVTLVKGKQGWRIGSVESEQNDYALALDREMRGSVVLVYRLLRRFVKGEEPAPSLYDFSLVALDELLRPQANRPFLELFIQMEMLALLGYVDTKVISDEVKSYVLGSKVPENADKLKVEMQKIIKEATDSSHL